MQITSRIADFDVAETIHLDISLDALDDADANYGYAIALFSEERPVPQPLGFKDGLARVETKPNDSGEHEVWIGKTEPDGAQRIKWSDESAPQPVFRFNVGGPRVARVQLVGPSAYRMSVGLTHPCAGYQGFLNYLRQEFDNAGFLGVTGREGTQPTPQFGVGTETYEWLIDGAKAYVSSCRCRGAGDLYPDGYLENRQRSEPHLQLSRADEENATLPCIELIWNYWQEEGMLAQTLNQIVARFQNRRASSGDPLARFDVSPLLPLRSLLWGWVENEQRRLTVRRRAAEYEFEYGLTLIGKAIPRPDSYVERRSGFLNSFHTILHQSTLFFKELDDLTITPDGFPLYEALRECHLVLSQGSQNQYGEMAVTARAEMLVMQHILAQPSMREFLGGRPMTPYPETWMDRVDSMKAIQGWSDASVLHFHDLATFGERLVLTIRLGNWAATNVSGPDAVTWATSFRSMIQRYIAAYRAVTGVDLSKSVDTTMPSTLIARRTADSRRRA